jgi:signal transduction histidine kinase
MTSIEHAIGYHSHIQVIVNLVANAMNHSDAPWWVLNCKNPIEVYIVLMP